ncbi:MAG: tetratricopeptide repeat protein, partial [Kofleriaceae bacterium]
MDRGVIAAASELFESKHYAEAAAICAQGLQHEPRCLPLLLLSARSFVALRREADARADLRDILRFAPECGMAFRLLGELAARREENETAAIFFREALRLDPSDREAADWLAIVTPSA